MRIDDMMGEFLAVFSSLSLSLSLFSDHFVSCYASGDVSALTVLDERDYVCVAERWL